LIAILILFTEGDKEGVRQSQDSWSKMGAMRLFNSFESGIVTGNRRLGIASAYSWQALAAAYPPVVAMNTK
jgi:hypothetical protein